jgi:wyosine [tRNA(Phe)-imidazoG37] synthetase (radical SAM superfamily)
MPKSTVYGPVASWRLGRSLGIDMLCGEQKTCNFDCVYCQLGPTAKLQTERREFVSLTKLIDDLNTAKGVAADWVTFSGMGEPTLAANLGAAISAAKSILGLPVAVLTNGGLIKRQDVRQELALADMVVAKLDAPDEALFRAINRPSEDINFAPIIQGWQTFRMEYKGKLAVSIMLNDLNKKNIYHLQYMARMVLPDQVQLNTPLRPCDVKPLPMEELEGLRKTWFWNRNAITVYGAAVPEVTPLDAEETELRNPTKARCEPPPAQPPTTGTEQAESDQQLGSRDGVCI